MQKLKVEFQNVTMNTSPILLQSRNKLHKLILAKGASREAISRVDRCYCSSITNLHQKINKNSSSLLTNNNKDNNKIDNNLKSSGSSSDETIDGPSHRKSKSPFIKLDPRAVFPWRHSSQPLPRLIPNTNEFNTKGNYIGPPLPSLNKFFRTLSWMNATGLLGGSFWNYLSWKDDLEEGFKYAFTIAVQGLLMDVYNGM